jgi:hypothetical protein
MRAYQIKLKGKNFGVPFARYNDMVQMLDNLKDHETTVTIQMLEIGVGDQYRNGNVIYMLDELLKGVVQGSYREGQPEHI